MLTPDDRLGVQGLRRALRDLGYTEGRNLALEARYHEGDAGRLSALAADLVKQKVDVIVAASSTEVRAARQATTVVPIVFVVHYDPIGTGDVASLAHPGGSITGLTAMGTDLTAKQLGLLREMVPRLRRLAILRNPTTPSHKLMYDASTVRELEHAYEAAVRARGRGSVSPVARVQRRQRRQRAARRAGDLPQAANHAWAPVLRRSGRSDFLRAGLR